MVYHKQGKHADALSWYERALDIDKREFGVDHINSAGTINDIGSAYGAQGKYAETLNELSKSESESLESTTARYRTSV